MTKALLREIDEYLSRSPAEAIHAGSALHRKIKDVLSTPTKYLSKRCADPWKHHALCRCLEKADNFNPDGSIKTRDVYCAKHGRFMIAITDPEIGNCPVCEKPMHSLEPLEFRPGERYPMKCDELVAMVEECANAWVEATVAGAGPFHNPNAKYLKDAAREADARLKIGIRELCSQVETPLRPFPCICAAGTPPTEKGCGRLGCVTALEIDS